MARSRLRRLAAGAAGAMALACAPTAAAQTPTVSIQDDRLHVTPVSELPARLDLLAQTGARVTRFDIIWSDIAPTEPTNAADPADPAYRWERVDATMRGLAARGIGSVIVDIYLAPRWATGSPLSNAAPRAAALGAFAGALAGRYSGTYPDPFGGTLPRIGWIEPWNEPNINRYLTPQCRLEGGRLVPVAHRTYAAMLQAAVTAIRAASPTTRVVAGAAGPQGGRQTRCRSPRDSTGTALLVEEIRRRRIDFDAWSQHLYPIGAPRTSPFFPSFPTLGRLERELALIRPGIPIYVDETGYHTSYNRAHRYFVSEAQQAAWLTDTWTAAAARPQVRLVTWFNLQDTPDWTGGLLRLDGTRKPAWDAFARLAATVPVADEWR